MEIIIFLILFAILCTVNLKQLFKDYLAQTPISPDNFIWNIAISGGKSVAILIFIVAFRFYIHIINKDYVMNEVFVYHDYPYFWYLFCSKILGIKKCNLILVPIYIQFKLVINSVFEEYPFDDNDYPIIENEPKSTILKSHIKSGENEINIILEDTYLIRDSQIPEEKKWLYTLRISRNDGKSYDRHFSPQFIEAIINCIREYRHIHTVNIFATTNPKNTLYIARKAFALGNRGNIDHLCVFQQERDNERLFKPRGHFVF